MNTPSTTPRGASFYRRIICTGALLGLLGQSLGAAVTHGYNRIMTRAGTDTVLTVPFAPEAGGSWTLDTLLPLGQGLHASSRLNDPDGDFLYFPAGIDSGSTLVGAPVTSGRELLLSDPWIYFTGDNNVVPVQPAGFYRAGAPEAVPAGDLVVTPGTVMVVRNNADTDGLIVLGGKIPDAVVPVPLGAGQADVTEDMLMANPYPVGLALNDTGLAGSAGFASSTSRTSPNGDYLLVYNRINAGSESRLDRAADAVYFHYDGENPGWYDLNDHLNGPVAVDAPLIPPSSGYLVRKRSGVSNQVNVSATLPGNYDVNQTPENFGVYFSDKFVKEIDNNWDAPGPFTGERNTDMEVAILDRFKIHVEIYEPSIRNGSPPPALLLFHGTGSGPSNLRDRGRKQFPEARVFAFEGPFRKTYENGERHEERRFNFTYGFTGKAGPNRQYFYEIHWPVALDSNGDPKESYPQNRWHNRDRPNDKLNQGFYDLGILRISDLIRNLDTFPEPVDGDPKKDYNCDPERVFLMGHSRGARFAWYLARHNIDRVHGLVVLGNTLSSEIFDENIWEGEQPTTLPVLEIWGSKDSVAAKDGVGVKAGRRATEALGMRNYMQVIVEGLGHGDAPFMMPNLRAAFFRQLALNGPRDRVMGYLGFPWLVGGAVPEAPVDPPTDPVDPPTDPVDPPTDPVDPLEAVLLEAEGQVADEVLTVTETKGVSYPDASGGSLLKIVSPKQADKTFINVSVEQAGTYRVKIGYKSGPDTGALSFWVNGSVVSAETSYDNKEWNWFDTYAPSEELADIFLKGPINLQAGTQQFMFNSVGAVPDSGGTDLYIDYIRLVPVNLLEMEDQIVDEVLTVTESEVVSYPEASGGSLLKIVSPNQADKTFINVSVEQAGTYRVKIGYRGGPDTGALSFWVNGNVVSAETLYNNKVWDWFDTYAPPEELVSIVFDGSINLQAGTQQFMFNSVGAVPDSGGTDLYIDYVRLIPE